LLNKNQKPARVNVEDWKILLNTPIENPSKETADGAKKRKLKGTLIIKIPESLSNLMQVSKQPSLYKRQGLNLNDQP